MRSYATIINPAGPSHCFPQIRGGKRGWEAARAGSSIAKDFCAAIAGFELAPEVSLTGDLDQDHEVRWLEMEQPPLLRPILAPEVQFEAIRELWGSWYM